MKSTSIWLWAAITLLCGQACSDPEQSLPREGASLTTGPGPSLVLIDSLILEDRDSVFLARPEQSFTVDSGGRYYVADEFMNRLVRYRADGSIDRVFGKAGDGPGEMRSTQRLTLLLDTVVIQSTAGKFVAYQRDSGAFLFQKSHERNYLTAAQYVGDTVLVPMFSLTAKKALLSASRASFLAIDSASMVSPLLPNLIDFPPEYLKYPTLQAFSQSALTAWRDTMMIGFSGVPYLVTYNRAGVPLDTIVIPARARHGHPNGWMSAFDKGRDPSLEELVKALSFLNQIWRLSDGETVLWHQDNGVINTGPRPRLYGAAYISVLAADRRKVCLDTYLPFPGTDWPRIAMHGDTLLALDQIAAGANADTVNTVIRRYRIDTSRCAWQKTDVTPRH